MIGSFEEIFPDLYSEEIFENPELLNWKSEQYLRTALEIRAAIGIYNENSPKKFNYNEKPIDNVVDITEQRELDIQMENFKNIWPIETNINPVTQKNRTWFKDKIASLLNMLKK
jgi:hypothetical protein